ncbi:flagellar hook protein FlgE [Rhizobium sp.]|jgi:flagellar hook protein FlgE|uniref:flagellar hook protein FlgE n=1 Tax=Rhizobium sp. TaxID=391 RepID=UPI000E9C97D5|nr:flagellar hook protein FlgE [Rhizobium sp.]
MSLASAMNSSVSGLTAQATKLTSIGDNISNSSTTGYKATSTAFSSLVNGGTSASTTQSVSQSGDLTTTSSETDLAIDGSGYFVVQDTDGNIFLTREGDFSVQDDGTLQNASGYTLMGYSYDNGEPASVINGFDGLVPVTVTTSGVTASASTSGTISGNLNASATAVTGDTASANTTDSTYTYKTSVSAYDAQGTSTVYDVYYTKTGDNTWDVAVYNQSDATETTSFPYSSGAVGTATLTFDSAGALEDSSENSVSIVDSTTGISLTLDMSDMTQLSTTSSTTGTVDGSAASSTSDYTIGTDGVISTVSSDGTTTSTYKIALATVASPDNLEEVGGTAYRLTAEAGTVVVGFAGTGSFGTIESSTLEGSTVDLASELSDMISAQRAYSANSKVFQTAADMLDTVINMVR